MKGTHINEPIVSFYKTDSIKITCSNEVNYEVDGEIGQTRALNIRLLKGGIDLRVPKSSTLKELT
jgi:diacylglycerol kinase family enzyme